MDDAQSIFMDLLMKNKYTWKYKDTQGERENICYMQIFRNMSEYINTYRETERYTGQCVYIYIYIGTYRNS